MVAFVGNDSSTVLNIESARKLPSQSFLIVEEKLEHLVNAWYANRTACSRMTTERMLTQRERRGMQWSV